MVSRRSSLTPFSSPPQAYRGYAKKTMQRALAATRKRHAHLLTQKQLDHVSPLRDEGAAELDTNTLRATAKPKAERR